MSNTENELQGSEGSIELAALSALLVVTDDGGEGFTEAHERALQAAALQILLTSDGTLVITSGDDIAWAADREVWRRYLAPPSWSRHV